MTLQKRLFIISVLSILAFGLIYPLAPIEPGIKAGLSILILVAGLWMTEALPIPMTALLIPLLATLFEVSSLTDSLAPFASPVVYLVFGGFILAAVLHKHGLDHWLAALTLRHCGNHTGKILIGIFIVTAFTSMWMSNASATLMMLPILCSLLQRLPEEGAKNTQTFALLGLAYASSLGGMMTLVGSPNNMIIATQLEMDFFDWIRWVTPGGLLFFPIMIGILIWRFKPNLGFRMSVDMEVPRLDPKQKIVLAIFTVICCCWMASAPLGDLFGIDYHMDTWIILAGAVVIVAFDLLKWKDIETHTQWGILILSGAGMALSALLQTSGAGEWLAYHVIEKAVGGNVYLFVIACVLFIIFLTEMMSNAAAAALAMPILIISATTLEFPVILLAPLVGMTASMAFMFPIATPPNAIVYGTGKIPVKQMISTGFILNLVGAAFVAGYVFLF
jgi:sodium-dependent dicarboxylate transporter 2/3/5